MLMTVAEYGADEFVKRIADPVWFQSLGTVLAFDWNASGLTTILTAALKESIRGYEKDLGIFICGGKGKTSQKTPEEIERWGDVLSLPAASIGNLVYNSKMSAKVDSALVQDGYQIYHHAFFFSRNGAWSVVQQGMNVLDQTARRYHWHSENVADLVCEPHTGIVSQARASGLNLTAKESGANREVGVQLAQNGYNSLMKDIRIIRKHFSNLSKMVSLESSQCQLTLLELGNDNFNWHPVLREDFSKSRYLEKILWQVSEQRPETYEKLLSLEGVGPKTMRALSLVAEVIYGAKPSYEDPARYSFAHGGKDDIPYPIDRQAYDATIDFFEKLAAKLAISASEKQNVFSKLRSSRKILWDSRRSKIKEAQPPTGVGRF